METPPTGPKINDPIKVQISLRSTFKNGNQINTGNSKNMTIAAKADKIETPIKF
jgi:hypothetical protein